MLALTLRLDHCMTARYLIPGHGISEMHPVYCAFQPHRTCYMTVPVRALILAFLFFFGSLWRLFDTYLGLENTLPHCILVDMGWPLWIPAFSTKRHCACVLCDFLK